MTEKKKSTGLEFLLLKLNPAANNKDMLVELAHEALCKSHSKRTFVERCGKDLYLHSLSLGANIAHIHAMTNKELTTSDKLYMVIKKYVELEQKNNPLMSETKAINNFCADLQKKCPQEYGIATPNKNVIKQPSHTKAQHSIV